MPVEVFVRNPRLCIKECLEVGVENVAWDRGLLRKFHVDPVRFMNLHYGETTTWRSLSIGDQGTTEYDHTSRDLSDHRACYPTWEYGEDFKSLIAIINDPAGENPDAYWSDGEDPTLRPVEGQEHKIIITKVPPAGTGPGRAFYRELSSVQDDHPEVTFHLHGLYSYAILFGLSFRSVDIEPRDLAAHGRITFPNGKNLTVEKAAEYPQWIKMLGMRPVELKIPRNRCMYNILSAGWAAKHFKETPRFSLSRAKPIDPDSALATMPTDTRIMLRNVKAQSHDKWLCDSCSLQLDCKYFREGAVCAVPESEPVELAHFFKTRDSGTIIDGLSTLLATQTHRVHRALEVETDTYDDPERPGSLDPELTKVINGIFDRGVKLAKLVDPALRAGPKVSINTNSNNVIAGSSPAALMAAVVEELTSRGVPRDEITPEMVMRIVSSPDDMRSRAIDAAAVETTDDDDEDDDWGDD